MLVCPFLTKKLEMQTYTTLVSASLYVNKRDHRASGHHSQEHVYGRGHCGPLRAHTDRSIHGGDVHHHPISHWYKVGKTKPIVCLFFFLIRVLYITFC